MECEDRGIPCAEARWTLTRSECDQPVSIEPAQTSRGPHLATITAQLEIDETGQGHSTRRERFTNGDADGLRRSWPHMFSSGDGHSVASVSGATRTTCC